MLRFRLLAAGLAPALFSCGGGDLVLPSEGEPAAITIVQGNGQSGRVGEILADPLILEVTDGAQRPVPQATVVIELADAVAEPDTLTTDGQGRATAQIILGAQVGNVSGSARVIAPESPIEVQAVFGFVALAASANGLTAVAGDDQTGPAGTELPDPLVVEVTDAFGNPIEGVPIAWSVEGGGGVSEAATTTGADGRTSVVRTLGTTAGQQATLASSEGLAGSPVVFDHIATAGSALGVLIVAGNNQIAPPGTTLPQDLVVQVVDAEGNPVVDAPITWVVTAGGGTLSPTTGTTDADGHATTSWTLGASTGVNTAQAIVSGVGQAIFNATATAGAPSRIRVVSGDDQTGQTGSRLAAELVVQVLDDQDNPVGGVTVTWAVTSGSGSVSRASATTDDDGQASTAWTLGPELGVQRVSATAAGAGSVAFEATATAGAPSGLSLVTQPSATARLGVPFARQPVVQVRDAAGNPVPTSGVTVAAAIATGGGQLIGTSTRTTGSDGRATFTDLGITGAIGPHSLIFAAGGFTSVTSATIDVLPAETTTRITSDAPDPSAPGEQVEVVFEVTSAAGITPVGTVRVTASGGSETCSATVAAGRCTVALVGAGTRTLTATFDGGSLFASSSDTESHRVEAVAVGTTTRITSDQPDPSAPGEEVEVVFEVTAPSGTPSGTVRVTASGGSESCSAAASAGRCTLVLTGTGDRTLTATFEGGSLFASSSDTESHRVEAVTTTTRITSDSPDPSAPGEEVEVAFEVTSTRGTPSGTVRVTASDGSESCSADASDGGCTVVLTVEGERTLTATFEGGSLFASSSDTEPHRVEAVAVGTTTRITSDEPDPSAPGEEVEVVFEVTAAAGTPSGMVDVTVSDGSETCSADVATGRCTIVLTAEGERTLTARFRGSDQFEASEGTTPHQVEVPNTPPSAVDDDYSATAGTLLSVSAAEGVLANDMDPDDPTTAQVLTPTTGGTLELDPDGSFVYTPDPLFLGQDSFTYEITAGAGTDQATARIIVSAAPGP